MKQALRKELYQVFEAPPPMHKREFMRKMEPPRMSTAEFIFSQIGYVRRWTWGLSASVFAISLSMSIVFSVNMLWAVSAFTPLLALIFLSESGRSESYEMAELEAATRFSLRSVLFARSGILGMENLVLLCLLVPVGLRNNAFSPLQAGVSVTAPFLLTTFTGLWIVRKFRGREAIYYCAGIAACISISVFFIHMTVPQAYHENHLVWWIAGILLLCIGTASQYCKMISSISV